MFRIVPLTSQTGWRPWYPWGWSRRATRLGIYLDVRRLEDLPSGNEGRESHNLNMVCRGIVRLSRNRRVAGLPVKGPFFGAGTA